MFVASTLPLFRLSKLYFAWIPNTFAWKPAQKDLLYYSFLHWEKDKNKQSLNLDIQLLVCVDTAVKETDNAFYNNFALIGNGLIIV